MRDKRPVDELSIEELERILIMRRREVRQERLRRYDERGRRVAPVPSPTPTAADAPEEPAPEPTPQRHEAAQDLAPLEPPVTYDITDDMPRFEDDDDGEIEILAPRKPKRPASIPAAAPAAPRRRSTFDRLLLGVEVLAVIGIIGVLVVGGYLIATENDKIEALEQKSADIQREAEAMRATATPAPVLSVRLSDYVLPGGHYSPNETCGGEACNLEELPESVRPLAMAQLNSAPQAALITPQPISPVQIEIPAIGVNASIYGGDDWYSLQKGVGHLLGSANPGESANMVLTAHNDIYGEIFRDLQLLEPGDEVRVMANNRRWYTYVVRDKDIVNPDDTWVLARGNQPIVTLITCHPYRVDTHRMVIFAELQPS
jgi:sortase A